MKKYYFFRLIALPVLAFWLTYTGCDGSFPDEGICEASDGTYKNSIDITWEDLADTEAGVEVLPESYTLERSEDDFLYFFLDTTLSPAYMDTSVSPGKTYYYRAYAIYPDGSTSDYTVSDSGFAMDAAILSIGSSPGLYTLTGTAGPDLSEWAWYKILAQQGWAYTVYTSSAGTGADTVLYLYGEEDIEDSLVENDDIETPGNLYSSITHTFTASGLYYIKVETYTSGDSFKLNMYHHEDIP